MEWTPLVLALAAILLGLFVAAPMRLLEQGAPVEGVWLRGGGR